MSSVAENIPERTLPTFRVAKRRAHELTMACWWPSPIRPGRINWPGILGELTILADQAIEHRDDRAEAADIRDVFAALVKGGAACIFLIDARRWGRADENKRRR